MKYISQMKDSGDVLEISKTEARERLEGYWTDDALADIFENNRAFRLWTPYRIIWTESDDGLVPAPGFYGIVG